MTLGESRVSLDQEVVKNAPLRVSPTFMEWVADGNAEQIIRNARVVNANVTIFTVPKNFTLFITSAFINTGHSTIDGAILVRDVAGGTVNFRVLDCEHDLAMTAAFPMPLVARAGNVIDVGSNGVGQSTFAGFAGFLLHKKISIR